MKGCRAIGSAQYYIFTSVCTFKRRLSVLFVRAFYLCPVLFLLMLIKNDFSELWSVPKAHFVRCFSYS